MVLKYDTNQKLVDVYGSINIPQPVLDACERAEKTFKEIGMNKIPAEHVAVIAATTDKKFGQKEEAEPAKTESAKPRTLKDK